MNQHKRKLRIATTVTSSFTSPQPKGIVYAPIDLAITLAKGLSDLGHSITYFGPQGSQLPDGVKLETENLTALKQQGLKIFDDPMVKEEGAAEKITHLWGQYLPSHMFKMAEHGQYDILHIHPVDRALPLAFSHPTIPTVYTLHDPIYPWRVQIFTLFSSSNQWYVSISDAQRKPAPHLQYISTIYNGTDVTNVPFSEKPGEYLLFVGRLLPKKGVAEAIKAAQRCHKKLIIIGPLGPEDYYETYIKPHLSDQIVYKGFMPRQEAYEYYKNALATLFPIQWEEPFGLVMTESMATGTPVIAFRRGSVPEVIVHGKTGFIVDTVDEMVEAVQELPSLDRLACRKHVEENFNTKKMIEGYEQAFYKILDSPNCVQ